ncbi:MAG: tRNA (guanosine(46)-N7)-methyltransferase TrmB [Pseudomonadota bacterium]
MPTNDARRGQIRSFVKRPGRLTAGQRRALDELWPKHGATADGPIDFAALFGRPTGLRVFEIGYGDGDSLVALAAANPGYRIIGCEVHEPGIGHCLIGIEENGLTNVRLITADAVDLLNERFAAGTLDRVNLYFPDPWPKKRHHKRRLFGPVFLDSVARVLAAGGHLHVATDWAPYAEHVDEVLAATTIFHVAERIEHDGDRPLARVTTKFERRGLALGHRIVDWVLAKTPS